MGPREALSDNGSEYSGCHDRRFHPASKLTQGGSKSLISTVIPMSPSALQMAARRLRARCHNAKGKPGIEVPLATSSKSFSPQSQAGPPATALELYHKALSMGGASRAPVRPYAILFDQDEATTLSRPEVLAPAFATRSSACRRVSYTPRRGITTYFHADGLLGLDHKITLRAPPSIRNLYLLADGEPICQAFPEQTFGGLDGAGFHEVNRRRQGIPPPDRQRKCGPPQPHRGKPSPSPTCSSSSRRDCGRWDDPRGQHAGESHKPSWIRENEETQSSVEQWKTGSNEVLAGFKFAEDEE